MIADADHRTATRLGRAVRATTGGAAATSAQHREEHRSGNWLRDVILGGQDGLVNILGIILGVIAGGGSDTVLLVEAGRVGRTSGSHYWTPNAAADRTSRVRCRRAMLAANVA